MKAVDPCVYRAVLDRLELCKKALRDIATYQYLDLSAVKDIANEALETIANADAWDNAPLDANGIPISPQAQRPDVT